MTYFVFAFLLCLLFGVLAIACNPSPYYGALSLVLAAGAASCVLAYKGATFLSLVLFLIYLGGMAVVFAFTVALSSEPFPSAWEGRGVAIRGVGFSICLVLASALYAQGYLIEEPSSKEESKELSMSREDTGGLAFLYSLGAGALLFTTCALLLTLFVVLELARGAHRASLRVVSMRKKKDD